MWRASGKVRSLNGEFSKNITGSIGWVVDFYYPGPPPVVLDAIAKRDGKQFYSKFAKLLDLKNSLDARAIMVAIPGGFGIDEAQLATHYGIYLVVDGDSGPLNDALNGKDVQVVNSTMLSRLLQGKSRKHSGECRNAITALLKKSWSTGSELSAQLKWRYDLKTINSQLRTLQLKGEVKVCGRTNSGDGLYGMTGQIYPLREDLSRKTRIKCLSDSLQHYLESKEAPQFSQELADQVKASRYAVRSALRGLSREGLVVKAKGGGWMPVHQQTKQE